MFHKDEIDCECEDCLPMCNLFSEYSQFNLISIIEPDWLSNVVANSGVYKCWQGYIKQYI